MAADYLLEIDGIKGESSDRAFAGNIEITSFGWGCSNSGTSAAGGGGGAGKVSFSDISFHTSVSKASPLLMLACASGQHIKKAILHVRKQGGEQQEYYTIKLEDILVTSYRSGDAPGGAAAVEDSFSLNFTKISFDYKPQKADGSLDSAFNAGWDVKKNVKA